MAPPRETRSPLPTGRQYLAAKPQSVTALCVAPEGPEPAVLQTILNSRAPSMKALYANRWKLFASWCDREMNRADGGYLL
ncbi:hypothetical protein N1851_032736 [Merluccius polli]|uniref:Uncharacterized protein n=1 Tax=Merluccius polli TaxID=89951 RepID=A0AA47NP90_MERPO|nr:hypothetical protein N1851_032736 [Merluccius polli]